MSDIPGARYKLSDVAGKLRALKTKQANKLAGDIEQIVALDLYRQSPVRRMKKKSKRVTAAVKEQILELARTTSMHEHEIAVHVGVNHGRVSEVLNGLR